MKSYFATDGSYGDAHEIAIIECVKFTEDDWQSIDEELDYYRAELAREIGKKYNG